MTNAEGTDWDEEFRLGGTPLIRELPVTDGIAVLRPGDKLVLRLASHVSAFEAERIKARCAEQLPGVVAVIVSGCDAWSIYRDEDAS